MDYHISIILPLVHAALHLLSGRNISNITYNYAYLVHQLVQNVMLMKCGISVYDMALIIICNPCT